MTGINGSFGHLIDQIDARLLRIEGSLDRIERTVDEKHDHLNGRVRDLENKNAEARGGWTVLTVIGTAAGAVGGIAAKWFGQ